MNNNTIYDKSYITILAGDKPSTKHYTVVDDKVSKGKTKQAYYHNYKTLEVNNLVELFCIILETSKNDNEYIIRGKAYNNKLTGKRVRRLQRDEDKKVGVFVDTESKWICLDFDEQIVPEHNRVSLDAVEWLIQNKLPSEFHNVSYVYQWSASAGLEYNDQPIKKGTNIHLFFFLDIGLNEDSLKNWLRDYDVDRAAFQYNQPIFVNPNVVKDEDIVDLIPKNKKIGYIIKDIDDVIVPIEDIKAKVEEERVKRESFKSSINIETNDIIIQKLNEVGCIVGKHTNNYSLKSPHESSQGGYYVRIDNPLFVHHGGKGSRRVDVWLAEEWGVDFDLPEQEQSDGLADAIKKFHEKHLKTRRDDSGSVRTIKDSLPEFVVEDVPFSVPFERKRRQELSFKKCPLPKNPVTLLYAFEGYGKSHLCGQWAKGQYKERFDIIENKTIRTWSQKPHKIIFACKSHEQLTKQAEGFKQQGLRVQIIRSRDWKLTTKHNVEIQRSKQPHPWAGEPMNSAATIKWMTDNGYKNVKDIWMDCAPEQPDFFNHDVVCMTFTMCDILGYKRARTITRRQNDTVVINGVSVFIPDFNNDDEFVGFDVPENTIVVFDDPESNDFSRLAPYNPKYDGARVFGSEIQTIEVNNRRYFQRPEQLLHGYGWKGVKLVFTTTELLTRELMYNTYDDIDEPELMPPKPMLAGDIHLIKTQMTREKKDGFLLPIVERLKKMGHKFEYMANGQGQDNNLSNTKGRNEFAESHTLVKISSPHFDLVTKYMDELGWETPEARNAMACVIALDELHQILGRNCGYRYVDLDDDKRRTATVLIEPNLFKNIQRHTRYYITSTLDLDNTKKWFEPTDFRTSVQYLIQNIDKYVLKGLSLNSNAREFEYDIKDALKVYDDEKRGKRLYRVALALFHKHEALLKSSSSFDKKCAEKIEKIMKTVSSEYNFEFKFNPQK